MPADCGVQSPYRKPVTVIMEKNIQKLQKTIGYSFRDINLLEAAMTHSSFANEHRHNNIPDNERLECLGDAVLELSCSVFLFESCKGMPEGEMTRLRASLVCEPTLALSAREINLPDYLRLGRGEENTGGRNRDSIISDALEALIGAVYLDGGFDCADKLIRRFILNDIDHKKLFYDSKTILQERVQRDLKGEEIFYENAGEEGPDHMKMFFVRLRVGGKVFAEGRGHSKKAAEQQAAYKALLMLEKSDGEA